MQLARRSIWRKTSSRCRTAAGWLLLFLACPSLAFASTGTHGPIVSFLNPHGPIAAEQRQHFYNIVVLMLIVLIPVLVGVPLIAWRYRYRNKSATYTPKWEHSWTIEGLIWGVPVAVVAVLAFWLVQDTVRLDPYRALKTDNTPLKVDVIGYDWKWLFVYPQLHIASVGQLVFPEHRPLSMQLTTDTVMQSFLIPALGSQIYAMAAMKTKLHLISDSTGQFLGENTQYDGMGFQHQRFVALATTPQGFKDWVARVKAHGVPLTANVYDLIRKHNTVTHIRTALKAGDMPPDAVFFNHVTPELFKNVMMSFHGGPTSSIAIVGEKPTTPHKAPTPNMASLTRHVALTSHGKAHDSVGTE